MFFKGMKENWHQQLFDILIIIKMDPLINFIDFDIKILTFQGQCAWTRYYFFPKIF